MDEFQGRGRFERHQRLLIRQVRVQRGLQGLRRDRGVRAQGPGGLLENLGGRPATGDHLLREREHPLPREARFHRAGRLEVPHVRQEVREAPQNLEVLPARLERA